MNTNDETIFCVWGARASRMLVAVSRRNELPCSVFATDYIDLYRSIGLGRTRTKSAVNLQLDPWSAQRFVSIRVHSWLQLILRPARVRIQGGQISGITSRLFRR